MWSGLFLFEATASASPRLTFLYGCMAEGATGACGQWPSEEIAIEEGSSVRQFRMAFDDGVAQAVRTGLGASSLDLTLFNEPSLRNVGAIQVGGPRRLLQPEEMLSVAHADLRYVFGVPPGYLGAPTLVESFFAPGWLPPAVDPARLVRVPSGAAPSERLSTILEAMTELSGLPFRRSYAERVRCFEVMTPSCPAGAPTLRWRIVRGASRGSVEAVAVEVADWRPTQVHVVLRRDGETVFERLYSRPATTSVPITIAVDSPPHDTEVRVFDADTGELRAHRRFGPILSIGMRSTIGSGRARLDDEVSRRAPPGRRDEMADVSRASMELNHVRHEEPDAARGRHASRMRALTADRAVLYHEWFPRGIGGELDLIERLRSWAEDPSIDEMVVADPFTSPQTLTRLVRRIRRENVLVTFVCSLGAQDPDRMGVPLDAVELLRSALDRHETEFACRLRVLNVVEDRASDEAGERRPRRQAFHDRYVVLIGNDGSRRSFTLGNSLNNASGNWPFVLAELRPEVGARVDAYVQGLMRSRDLARDLPLAVDLDWTNARAAPPSPPTARRVGFSPSEVNLRTLAWLAGDADWAGPVGRRTQAASLVKREARRLLSRALGARLVVRRKGRIELLFRRIEMALTRSVRSRPPRSPHEAAILLRGLGEIGAWSRLSPARVGAKFRSMGIRVRLPRILDTVVSQVPLEASGSGELETEGYDTMPLGRRLVWMTGAALDNGYHLRSPDYGLTGAIRAALHIDAPATLSFLARSNAPGIREIGIALLHEDFGPFGRKRLLPAVLRSPSLAVRMTGLLHMVRPATYGGAGLDAERCQTLLLRAGCTREERLVGAIVAYDRAFFQLALARSRSRAKADLGREVENAAAVVGSLWSPAPPDTIVDAVADILDWHGEKMVVLAEAISAAGGDASGLHRRLLRRFDETVGLPAFDSSDPVSRDRALHDDRWDPSSPHDLPLWAAISYLRLTGERRVTSLATRYVPLLEHCERQVYDPLFRAFRNDSWRDRVGRLVRVYGFVFRILDEAKWAGFANGVGHFERDVAGRTERLLGAIDSPPGGDTGVHVAMLARDLARSRLSGRTGSLLV